MGSMFKAFSRLDAIASRLEAIASNLHVRVEYDHGPFQLKRTRCGHLEATMPSTQCHCQQFCVASDIQSSTREK